MRVTVGKLSMTVEDNAFFAKRNVTGSAWKEAGIKGADATFPETRGICEGRAVPGLTAYETVAVNGCNLL